MSTPQPGLAPSDADYLGHPHQQLKSYVETNLDVEQVSSVSHAYTEVQKAFEDFATQLGEAVKKAAHAWSGEAAAGAQAYFVSLAEWAEANGQNAKLAAQIVEEQASAAQTAKHSMPDAVPFDWSEEFDKWSHASPLEMSNEIDATLKKQQDSRSAHEQAAETMSKYDASLHETGSKQPTFAHPPKFGVAAGGGAAVAMPTGPSHHDAAPAPAPAPAVADAGAASAGAAAGGGGATAGHASTPTVSGPSQFTGAVHQQMPDPSTTAAGTAPAAAQAAPSGGSGGASGAGMGAMPMGGMPMGGGGGGFGADEEHETKVGRGGGAGSFGPGDGAGAADVAAGGMGGAPARPGMGFGARPYDDGNDQPAFVMEIEDDEVFGSGHRSAPPVIGE
ncbi:hypothetical protein L3Q65_37210 [Amycolatopsis sp. FU40]|uniref:hypothetical protein n=1 Tax=Amycolatopsis sp. FU40 TaxID=2914159 RepID=UPI001F22B205|nr:hypothetical protein [Amycolatopsis sp. FU40]UKD53491.1 hypothetical protein L3Q65_37210 [Amycolatopsis sp. FU40]